MIVVSCEFAVGKPCSHEDSKGRKECGLNMSLIQS
jgi:hypothetical protein